jgi:hypothetical protein
MTDTGFFTIVNLAIGFDAHGKSAVDVRTMLHGVTRFGRRLLFMAAIAELLKKCSKHAGRSFQRLGYHSQGCDYTYDMDTELKTRIDALEQKLDAIYVSTEKTRKYLQWTLIVTVVVFVVPLIGLAFAIPAFLNSYVGQIQNLGV